jgi:SAM-dependent methyltransferase
MRAANEFGEAFASLDGLNMNTSLIKEGPARAERTIQEATREFEQQNRYANYYLKAGTDRNDLRSKEVLFQVLASERCFIRAFRKIAIEPQRLIVLDIGCGSGASWYQLFRLGVNPANTTGIDIQSDRLGQLNNLYPQAGAIQGDASAVPFGDGSFDLVYESTLFATLSDGSVRKGVASEMLRVCKENGYILLIDWRVRKFWDKSAGALNRGELKRLFGVGESCALISVSHGALLPPLDRMLSKHAWPLYFLVAWLCPLLVGQVAYLLQKFPNKEGKQ